MYSSYTYVSDADVADVAEVGDDTASTQLKVQIRRSTIYGRKCDDLGNRHMYRIIGKRTVFKKERPHTTASNGNNSYRRKSST